MFKIKPLNQLDIASKKFIKDNQDLIEQNNFEKLLEIAQENPFIVANNITQFLLGNCSINIFKYMDSIPISCFYGATYLDGSDIVLPDNIEYISKDAFAESGVSRITIEGNLSFLGIKAFYNCPFLEEIVFKGNVNMVGAQAFDKSPNLTIKCPRGMDATMYTDIHHIPVEYI